VRSLLYACFLSLIAGSVMAQQGIYSTRDNPQPPLAKPAPAQPLPDPRQLYAPERNYIQRPTASTPRRASQSPQQRAVPFGRASAPLPEAAQRGPRASAAAPVEAIDSGELDFLEETDIVSEELPPLAAEDATDEDTRATMYAEDDPSNPVRAVRIRALHKVTAKLQEVDVPIDGMVRFGRLGITPRACRTATDEYNPEMAALIDVLEYPSKRYDIAASAAGNMVDAQPIAMEQSPAEKERLLFSGWMFAKSPSINGLEHPVYDLRVVSCVHASD
jgi:hypothetical protein